MSGECSCSGGPQSECDSISAAASTVSLSDQGIPRAIGGVQSTRARRDYVESVTGIQASQAISPGASVAQTAQGAPGSSTTAALGATGAGAVLLHPTTGAVGSQAAVAPSVRVGVGTLPGGMQRTPSAPTADNARVSSALLLPRRGFAIGPTQAASRGSPGASLLRPVAGGAPAGSTMPGQALAPAAPTLPVASPVPRMPGRSPAQEQRARRSALQVQTGLASSPSSGLVQAVAPTPGLQQAVGSPGLAARLIAAPTLPPTGTMARAAGATLVPRATIAAGPPVARAPGTRSAGPVRAPGGSVPAGIRTPWGPVAAARAPTSVTYQVTGFDPAWGTPPRGDCYAWNAAN
jgi:hypothetical protein